jgi:hypothetical protein
MNALTPADQKGTALASFGTADPFAAAARDAGIVEGNFLKFDGNSGDYTYGSADNSAELEHGTKLAVDMTAYQRGWICWKEGEVVDQNMVNILDGDPPQERDLEDHGPYETYDDGTHDGWSSQHEIELRAVEDGTLFHYKTTSKSGLRALGKLLADFAKAYKSKPGEYPVIEIGDVTFEPKTKKKVGKKHAPTFKIVEWISTEKFLALAEAEAAAAPEEGADDPGNYTDAAPTDGSDATGTPAPTNAGRRAKKF